MTDRFWAPRLTRNRTVTLPFELAKITARQDWLLDSGIVESAIYTQRSAPGPALHESVIAALSQINAFADCLPENRDFEITEACHRALGTTPTLPRSLERARHIDEQIKAKNPPYTGLEREALSAAALYRVTGQPAHLKLAQHYLDTRGRGDAIGKSRHTQSHLPVTLQTEAVGHAVNGLTLILSLLEVGALAERQDYLDAAHQLWSDVVATKMYVTGGVGATGNEGFGPAYMLPNLTAYSETCATIMFCRVNQTMYLQTGDARYVDLYERALYNALLSGVSHEGDAFFYVNRLASAGAGRDQRWQHASLECCPPNLTRILSIMPDLIYTQNGQAELSVNLYVAGEAQLKLAGQPVSLHMTTNMPWDGRCELRLRMQAPVSAAIRLRIPGWACGEAVPGDLYRFYDDNTQPVRITVNDRDYAAKPDPSGFVAISRSWEDGDCVQIDFPMPVRRVVANPKVTHCVRRQAFQRGPIVYCAESIDLDGRDALNLVILESAPLHTRYDPDLLGGAVVIETQASLATDPHALQRPARLIPYALWANRGPNAMAVWLLQSPYQMGDVGPAGGFIFYENPAAARDGWRYLEAAPLDQSRNAPWGRFRKATNGAAATGIGTGRQNTNDMLSAGCEPGSAAALATSYSISGFGDWFLPSRDELIEMYRQLGGRQMPGSDAHYMPDNCEYWSSSQISIDMAHHVDFADDGRLHGDDKDYLRRVRAIRTL